MARAQSQGASGAMWIQSATVPISGYDLRGSVFVRTNLKDVQVHLRQYDAQGQIIHTSKTTPFTPAGWQWDEVHFYGDIVFGAASADLSVTGFPLADREHYLDLDLAALYRTRVLHGVHSGLAYRANTPLGIEKHVQMDKDLGARVSRMSAPWVIIETSPGQYDWAQLDQAVDALLKADIAPLLVITTSPQWANGSSNPNYIPPGDGDDYWQWRYHYGEFVKKLVARYKDRVRYWEVGNEVNIHVFWAPAPNVWQYCTWASHIYDTIKAEQPSALVALAGLAVLNQAWGSSGQQISGAEFIRWMLDWNGGALAPKMNIVSVHPYSFVAADAPDATPGAAGHNRFRDVETIHAVIPQSQIWITEYGWTTDEPGAAQSVSESVQQQYLEQALALIEDWDFVDLSIVFWDADRSTFFEGCGLIRSDGSMRPAGESFRNMVGREAAPDSGAPEPDPAPAPDPAPVTSYDFLAEASKASWHNANGKVAWGTNGNDGAGSCAMVSATMEDNQDARVLYVHPQWVDGGFMHGGYSNVTIPKDSPRFNATFGFVKGADSSDGVTFSLSLYAQNATWHSFFQETKTHDARLNTVSVELDRWAGQTVTLFLNTDAGGSPNEDWAAWKEAKITSGQ